MIHSPSPNELRQAISGPELSPALRARYTQLPHSYPQVQALAEAVTAGATTTYDRVQDLISWIGAHTHYSTDIPALPPGADTVKEFLFGNRIGYCEQISTSLAVMLRTLNVPVREVVGYVPGPYNPVTDLYTIQADDAHAWVQVWIPGYGWQSFDPTATVPLANPSPGATALHDVAASIGHLPAGPVSGFLVVAALGVALVRWRRSRPATWADRLALDVERAGRRAGRPRRSSETFVEYATALDDLLAEGSVACRPLAVDVEASVYGGHDLPPEVRRRMIASVRGIRLDRRRAGSAVRSGAVS